ncbi:deoxyribose-phosphate aldolase [Wenzhouxiangella sp. XN79A]|uniref:deoxyribose-phosphate aldolase n=1 Tax=Wenzhouxiangella sp. XN79A TaxID=2724193 RepID=UPI00144A56BE|nr:deoxyribose-phosphate aldolase [Wenzhouxiangella sp. XN79A]NKI34499.1 deoxyribose-phosphate aldolase [Wenzhouxiangella sp. XN79A]
MCPDRLRALLGRLDLTRLAPDDDADSVAAFCATAASRHGAPAAVCILPAFVELAARTLDRHGLSGTVRVATVANFPGGDRPVDAVFAGIERSLADGADEIDLVLPWRDLVAGRIEQAAALLDGARKRSSGATLKVILETGALTGRQLDRAADLALDHGADFLKTSTGVDHPGASPEAAGRLLQRISARRAPCGLKVSGGIRTIDAASAYLALAEQRMGPDWPSPERFRIGASGLLDRLLEALDASR